MNIDEFEKQHFRIRTGTHSIKWNRPFEEYPYDDLLPVHIADMDYCLGESLMREIRGVCNESIYGYAELPKDYFDVMIDWHKHHRGIALEKEWIRFSSGAVAGLYQILYSISRKKDGILSFSPSYPHFKEAVEVTGRTYVNSALRLKDGRFYLDFEDIEQKCSDPSLRMKAMILCSPHNPLGRVFSKEELIQLLEIACRHRMFIIFDEVHMDLIQPEIKALSALTFAHNRKYKNHIICIHSLSKTFNLSGLAHSHIITPNQKVLSKIDQYQKEHYAATSKVFNALPTYFCYRDGDQWMENVKKLIARNYAYFKEEMKDLVFFSPLEGSYLLFVDLKPYLKKGETGKEFLLEKTHVLTNPGDMYGKEYASWVRINLASSFDVIKDLVRRMKAVLGQ